MHVHFMGIGGIGMSSLASILRHNNSTVSGCDVAATGSIIENLKCQGCTIYQGHATSACFHDDITTVVYSTAIAQDHPELQHAYARGITVLHRSELLAMLMESKKGIAISGAHGKTTTTSLIAHCFTMLGHDPTVVVGGIVPTLDNSNARIGNGSLFIAEADESDRSFLRLPAFIKVVTNIDFEHLETYKDMDDIVDSFFQFMNTVSDEGITIACYDNIHIQQLLPQLKVNYISYGFDKNAHIIAYNIQHHDNGSHFCVRNQITGEQATIHLPIFGTHNISNALAVCAIGSFLKIPFDYLAPTFQSFAGVDRRFTKRGMFNGAEIIDDYGHHPQEIKAVIDVARKVTKNKLIVIFQPHRYSRTQALWHDFIQTLSQLPIDHLIITDIYGAGEKILDNITSEQLVFEMINKGNMQYSLAYLPFCKESIKQYITKMATPGDICLFLGAGNIYEVGIEIII